MQGKRDRRGEFRGLIESLESRRLLSAGGLDPSFGGDGSVEAGFPKSTAAGRDMAVQSDGKVVEVGSAEDSTGMNDLALVRYNTNGTLDTSFGPTQSGKVVLRYSSSSGFEVGEAVAIQADGKIVVAATRSEGSKFDILRFNSDGSLDKTFGSNGLVNVNVGTLKQGEPSAIAIQKDGRIVVVGSVRSAFSSDDDFEVVRLNTNGSLDQSFGNLEGASQTLRTGQTTVDFGNDDDPSDVVIDYNDTAATNPDYGRIVVSGSSYTNAATAARPAIARFNTNGTPDTSFAGDGKRVDSLSGDTYSTAPAVAIVGDGYLVTAGGFSTNRQTEPAQGFLLRGYTPSGSINTSFGTNGVVKTTFNGGETEAFSIINGFSQRLIVGGIAGEQIGLAAYTLDGQLDPAFGKGGKVITPTSGNNQVEKLAPGPNRTIVALTQAGDFSTNRYFDVGPTVSVRLTRSHGRPDNPQPRWQIPRARFQPRQPHRYARSAPALRHARLLHHRRKRQCPESLRRQARHRQLHAQRHDCRGNTCDVQNRLRRYPGQPDFRHGHTLAGKHPHFQYDCDVYDQFQRVVRHRCSNQPDDYHSRHQSDAATHDDLAHRIPPMRMWRMAPMPTPTSGRLPNWK